MIRDKPQGPARTQKAIDTRLGREVVLIYAAIALAAAGAVFLYYVGQHALMGALDFQFYADSNTYHDMYAGLINRADDLVSVSYNYLGPMMILTVFGGNIYLVMLFNIAIFTASIIAISRALNLNPITSALLQIVSPLTLASLMSVNKEIMVYPALALIIVALRNKSIMIALLSIVVSLFCRWQLTAFLMILIALYPVRNFNRYAVIGFLTIGISTFYFAFESFIRPVFNTVEAANATLTEGSGIFERLLDLQAEGFYFAVLPFKAAHLMFTQGLRFDNMLNPIVVYVDQIVALFCLLNIIYFIVVLFKGLASPKNDLIAISLVFIVVFGLTPVYSPRYFYPVFILWAFVLAGARGSIAGNTVVCPAPARG